LFKQVFRFQTLVIAKANKIAWNYCYILVFPAIVFLFGLKMAIGAIERLMTGACPVRDQTEKIVST